MPSPLSAPPGDDRMEEMTDEKSTLTTCELGHDIDDMSAFEKDLWQSVAANGETLCFAGEFANIVDGGEAVGWFDAIGLNSVSDSSTTHSNRHYRSASGGGSSMSSGESAADVSGVAEI